MPQAVVAALVKIGTLIVGSLNAAYLGYKTVAIIGAVTVAGSVAAAKRLFAIELPKVDTDGSRQRTVKSTTEAQKVIYGEALVSGPISYIGLKGTNNKDLYQVISLAGHEVNAITDVHFDSQVIANASIGGGSANGGAVSGIFSGYATINKHLGLSTETADSLLTTAFGPASGTPASSQYTSNHRGDGIAYLAMKWTLDEDSAELWEKYSPQNVKALVQGKKVYDPRLDSTAGANPENTSYIVYQTNPVNCLIDYLMDDNYGMGIPADKINWPAAVTAANGCDVTVNVPGGTESRFTCNGVIFATDSHKKNIAKILSSMNGTLVYTNGKYVIKSGIYYDYSADLNEDDLTGAITVKTSFEGSDRFNTIKGLFIDPSQNHKSSEFPKVQLTDAVDRDNDKVLEKEIALNMTNTSYMAQRIANKLIQQSSQQKIINFPANLSAMRIAVGDRVRVTVSDLSWSNKIFECIGWTFSDDGGINLTLREDSDQAYDDPDPSENEYSTISATGDITDAFRGVPSPSGLTATPGLKSNELNWVNPLRPADYGTIYVYASRNANFSSAVKIGETDGTQFIHDSSNKSLIFSPSVVNLGDTYTIRTIGNTDFTAMGAASNTVGVVFTATATGSGTGNLWETIVPGNTRYYWVRAIKNVGTDSASRSNLEPISDPNTTVFATVGAVEVDWGNVADPTIGIDLNNDDTISINLGDATATTSGQAVAQSGISEDVTITQGGIRMNQGGSIRGGQTSYNSGEGFFLGYDSNKYKLSIRNSTSEALTFNGEDLSVTGDITATSGTFAGSVSVNSSGKMYGGTMSSFNTGAGFFLGYDTDAYKFSVGNSSSKVLTWDGDNLNVEANLVSFTTGNEQVYSSLSRLPPGVVSASRSLGSNSDYFYFDSEIDVIQPSFVVSYNLGALTSGSISGQTNSRNAILSTIKLELFYATGSYAGTPGSWTLWDDSTFTSSTLGSGQPSMSDNTLVVQQVDLGGGNWETKLLTRKEYREYANDDYYSASFTPNNVVDDEYYLNWRVQKANNIEWPAGARFLKVVATVTNGSYTPYPSTGSPSITETRIVSIAGGTLYEQENHGLAIALGGQGWDNATRYIGLRGQTVLSGGEVTIGAPRQNIGFPGDTAKLKLVGFDTDNGSIRNLSAIEFHNGLSTLNGSPEFEIYVPNAGNVLAFAGNVNFNSDVDVDGTLSINGVTVNAGAVTGPAGSDTQIQYNDGGSLGASSNLTFNDSTNTLTVQNLTVSGTTTTVNSANLTVKDPNITLNYSTGDSSSTADNAGITIQDAVDASTDASILWKTASDSFLFSHKIRSPQVEIDGETLTSSDDLDNLNDGFYKWASSQPTNAPVQYMVMYQMTDPNQKIQIAWGASTNGKLYVRRADGGTFYAWTQMLTTASASSTYLPLSGGTLTGDLTVNQNGDALNLRSTTNAQLVRITFSSDVPAVQIGHIEYTHSDSASYGSNEAFIISGTEGTRTILADGKLMFKEGIYSKPTSGTGAGTRKDANWDSAYTYSTVGHLPLAGGTLTGALDASAGLLLSNTNITEVNALSFNDPGPNEGISWTSGNTAIFESPDNLTTNSAGNLQFVYGGTRRLTVNNTGIDVNGQITTSGAITSSGSLVLGPDDVAVQSDANITIREGNAFAGIDLKSLRTSGNISGIRSWNSSNTLIHNLLFEVGGRANLNNTGGLALNSTTFVDANRNISAGTITSGAITSTGLVTADRFLSGLGTAASPAYKVGDTDSGFYDSGGNMIGVSLGGVLEYDFQPTQLDLNGNNIIDAGNITLANGSYIQLYTTSGDTGGGSMHLPRGGQITFYGNANNDHSISSRNSAGAASDDIRISSYGSIIFDLDSNGNNSSAADFIIGRHGGGNNQIGTLLTISGETGAITTGDGSTTAAAYGFNGDVNTGMYSSANHEVALLANGTQRLKVNSTGVVVTGAATFSGDITVSGNQVNLANVGARVKYSVWSGTTYGIGMQTGYTFGAISNDYVMSFQMSNTNNRGFWWGDASHTNAQGAMALSTDGYLTVARGMRLGYGESDTTHPAAGLQVSGDLSTTGLVTADRFFSGLGTAASPAYQVGDTNSGFYDSGGNFVGVSCNGVLEYEFQPTTFDVKNNTITNCSSLYVDSYIYHNGDTNTYLRFLGDDMLMVAGGRQMIRMDEGVNPDILEFVVSATYTDSNGNIVASGNITAYASDRRLKTNIQPIENALEKIKAIRGVTYDWKDQVTELGFYPDRKTDCMGVIAQELEEAGVNQVIKPAPFDQHRSKETNWEFVSKSGENYKTVDYDKLTALCIQGIKEQQEEIEELKSLVKILMEKINGDN
jgi:hypothetical protein